jgi:single-strand DNA-binding protein
MAGETTITVVGNLVADVELRFVPSGAAVASFSLASTPRLFDKNSNEWKDGDTLFLRCSIWRQAAENLAESALTKGTRVIVTGRLKQRTYDDREGVTRTVVELDVEEIGPSLKYATAKVTKATRTNGAQGGGEGASGGAANGSGWGSQFAKSGASPARDDPWATGAPVGAGAGDEPPF